MLHDLPKLIANYGFLEGFHFLRACTERHLAFGEKNCCCPSVLAFRCLSFFASRCKQSGPESAFGWGKLPYVTEQVRLLEAVSCEVSCS